MNVGTLIERTAQTWPERFALIDEPSGRRYTFAEFVAGVFATAKAIATLVRNEAGSRIAILGDAGVHYLFADYGAMSAGFVRVPLDPSLSVDELTSQLRDAGAAVLLFDARYAEAATQIADRILTLTIAPIDEFGRAHGTAPISMPVRSASSDLASLNYTGGSTGVPKAVMLTHGNFAAILQNIVMARPIHPGDVFLNVRPLWPIAAVNVLAHLLAGGTVVNAGRFSPDRFWTAFAAHDVVATSLVPTQLVRLLREPPATMPSIAHLRHVDMGAAAVSADMLAGALAVFGPTIGVIYGLTEASWSFYRAPRDLALVDANRPETLGCVGQPLFGVETCVMDDDGALPGGTVGEVCIRGNHVMHGYWNQPDLTAHALRDGWFHTGDLGRIDSDGRLYLAGRAKDIIRTGGKTVQPGEVEATLEKHEAVLEVSVVGMPDEEWGEIVVAAVVVKPGSHATAAELSDYCRAELSSYKRPKLIRFFDDLPKSHYGKVQRNKLKERLTEGTAS